MSLVTIPGKISILDSHVLIVMADDHHHQAVCISADILPDDAKNNLRNCLDFFERIAERKLANGQIAYDGRVWITSSDVVGCPPHERH